MQLLELGLQPGELGDAPTHVDELVVDEPGDVRTRAKVYGRRVDVTLLRFDGCPSWRLTDERLAEVARERPDVRVIRRRIESAEQAEREHFHGSPSILVDGVDPFARSRCRRRPQ